MTPQEKAKELVYKYYHQINPNAPDCNISFNQCKQCALIAVAEILNLMIKEFKWDIFNNGHIEYWLEVKQEIEKI